MPGLNRDFEEGPGLGPDLAERLLLPPEPPRHLEGMLDEMFQALPVGQVPEKRSISWDVSTMEELPVFDAMADEIKIGLPPNFEALGQSLTGAGVASRYEPTLRTLKVMPFALGMSDKDRVKFFLENTQDEKDPFKNLYLSMGLKPKDYYSTENSQQNLQIQGRIWSSLDTLAYEDREDADTLSPLAEAATFRYLEYSGDQIDFDTSKDMLDMLASIRNTRSWGAKPFEAIQSLKSGHPALELVGKLGETSDPILAGNLSQQLAGMARNSNLAMFRLVVAVDAHYAGASDPIRMGDALEGVALGIANRRNGAQFHAGVSLLDGIFVAKPEDMRRYKLMDDQEFGHLERIRVERAKYLLGTAGLDSLVKEDGDPVSLERYLESTAALPKEVIAINRRALVAGVESMLEKSVQRAIDQRIAQGETPAAPPQLRLAFDLLYRAGSYYGVPEVGESLARLMPKVANLGWTWGDEPEDLED